MSPERLTAIFAIFAVVVAGVSAILHGWTPVSDQALIELMVRDVPLNAPLVGSWSRFGWSHPGPAQFYFLAVFYWLGARTSVMLLVGTIVMHATAALIAWYTARQVTPRAGPPVVVGALAIVLTTNPTLLRDPWNPFVATLGALALCCAAWGFAERQTAGAIALFPVATFLLQAHLANGPFVVAVVVGAVLLSFTARSEWLPRREIANGALIAAVMWIPPLVQQLISEDGNMSQILNAEGHGAKLGIGSGLRVLTQQTSMVPDALSPGRFDAGLLETTKWGFPFWGIALALAVAVFVRKRDWTLLRCAAIAVFGLGGATAGVAMITDGAFTYLAIAFRSAVVFSIVTCVLALMSVLGEREQRSSEVMYGIATVLALIVGITQISAENPLSARGPTVEHFADAVERADIPYEVGVEQTTIDVSSAEITTGLFLELEKRGYRPGGTFLDVARAGKHRLERPVRYQLTVSQFGAQESLRSQGWTILAEYQPFTQGELAKLEVLKTQVDDLATLGQVNGNALRIHRIEQRMEGIRKGRVSLILAGRPLG